MLIGHSLGGLIATRYALGLGLGLAALVLSGPVVGGNLALAGLLAPDDIPPMPIDPSVRSPDPAVGQAYATDPLVVHGPLPRQLIEESDAVVEVVGQGGNLGTVPAPWRHGSEDQLTLLEPTRQALARISGPALTTRIHLGARHEVIDGTNSDEVLQDLIGFLRVVRSGRSLGPR